MPYNQSLGIFIVDTITISFFLFDYVIRFATSDNKFRFAITVFNIFDLAVIIPYFVEYGLEAAGSS